MNNAEARKVLLDALERYRSRTFAELRELMRSGPEVEVRIGPSGARYQLEVEAFWDGESEGPMRVWGNVDDGGLRSFMPLTECFIMSPDGSFVDE